MDTTAFFNIIKQVEARWRFVDSLANKLGIGEDFELSTLEDALNEVFKTFEEAQSSGKFDLNGEVKELRNQFDIMSDNITELEYSIDKSNERRSDIECTLSEFDQIIHGLEQLHSNNQK